MVLRRASPRGIGTPVQMSCLLIGSSVGPANAGVDNGSPAVHENYPPAPYVVLFSHSLGW
jgi:hypothetical protein